ncbi:LacI family DNA-binding transcriptional regulator [Azospirillum sp. B4]|uniref:LacI family DNA-binding transcriptional regulator n=1 Tax=Azospirillum sp. B4 TaxID=95605 RepID=UPI00034C6C01|nr:LacI family DNA-binding transcriptional regulator [Azospirillum sp. B4]
MPTIQDVARQARVSTATVSRVLSTPEVVSEATRERVMSAVDALGYEPNHAAKSLRTLRTAKIVVTVPDISNPFFSSVIRGAEEAAQAAGYSLLLGDTRNMAEREEQYAGMLRRKEADGLIFLGHRLPATLAGLIARQGTRAPVVNGCEFSPELGVSSAHIDNAAAAEEAMDLLYGLGHRDIGVITGPLASPISRDRLKGVHTAAGRHQANTQLRVATGDFTVESGEREARSLLAGTGGPTALFCFSDEMAMGALAAIRQAGRRCPDDISLVGFDDIRFARYLDPALTTVNQPMEEIGRTAVALLLEILGGTQPGPRSITLPHHLVVRGSTARAKA